MWLWASFLVVISCIRLPMNNYQAIINTNPFKISLFFTIRQYLYRLFLLSSIIPIFQSLLIIALIRPTQWLVPWSVKLGLGVYQVIWYLHKSFVRGVNHVLRNDWTCVINDKKYRRNVKLVLAILSRWL